MLIDPELVVFSQYCFVLRNQVTKHLDNQFKYAVLVSGYMHAYSFIRTTSLGFRLKLRTFQEHFERGLPKPKQELISEPL